MTSTYAIAFLMVFGVTAWGLYLALKGPRE